MASDRKCELDTCVDPKEIGCNRGFEFLEECPHWNNGRAIEASDGLSPERADARELGDSTSQNANRHLLLPWTGNSLGLLDVELVTACNRTTLVGLVGPYNAGKTTLLTLFYLLIQRGEPASTGRFAGSWSLNGWENLAASLRWERGQGGPRFPPHTSRGAGRRPGLLHLAFRDPELIRRVFLLTDPPGEWFSAWAQKENAEGAEGARWVQKYADRFLFLVDREALSGNERGKERETLRDLARRLSTSLRGRPTAVVWTKSDKPISRMIESDLQECFAAEFPGHSEFRVRLRFGDEPRDDVEEPCLELMRWTFGARRSTRRPPIVLPLANPEDLFLSYRGQGGRP